MSLNNKVNIDNTNIDIEYNIPHINFNGMMSGSVNDVIENFINMIETKLINKYVDYNYYIHADINDNLPSPFSNSNTIKLTIPSIFYDIIKLKIHNYIFNIKFFPNTDKINFFDNKSILTYSIEIINLNK